MFAEGDVEHGAEVGEEEDKEEAGKEDDEVEGGVAGPDGDDGPAVEGEDAAARGEVVGVAAEPGDRLGLDGGSVGDGGVAAGVVGDGVKEAFDGADRVGAVDPVGEELVDVAAAGDAGQVVELGDAAVAGEGLEDAQIEGGGADASA